MTREEAIRILENLYNELTDMLEILDDEGGDVCGSCLDEQKAVEIAITNLKISVQSDNIQKTLNGIFDNDKVNRLNPPEPTMPISCSEKPNECKENDTLANLDCVQELENAIGLIQQNGKDWLDERDIPILEEAIKAMKKEPCEDCISFPKGTLKKRGKGYVVYNVEWLKKHWQTELKIMGIECEDTISRQAAIVCAREHGSSLKHIRDLEQLPMVTSQGVEQGRNEAWEAEQKVGRWIKRNNPDLGICMQELKMCSVCGRMFCARYNPYWSYCGNCGAKMEEGE